MLSCVFFPGTFNPFTKGHADIVNRLLSLAERVVVGIGFNIEKETSLAQAEENAVAVEHYLKKAGLTDRVSVTTYSGLTAKAAKEANADCMVRGARSAADFDYEFSLAAANRTAFGIETLILPADPGLACVSSTIVRDLLKHGDKLTAEKFLP